MDVIWTRTTPNFRVTLECDYERDEDLSWADEEVLENLRSGKWTNFTFAVKVYDRNTGAELGADYLGNSIYEDPSDFRRDGYFSDMLARACR